MTVRIINADCIDALRAMPEASVHCVVTSPPYWGLRDYGVPGQLGLETLHDCLGWATGNRCGECHVCHIVDVFREVWRVLRDDGTLWLNYGDSYYSPRWNGGIGENSKINGQWSQEAFRKASRQRRAGLSGNKRYAHQGDGSPNRAYRLPGLKSKDLVMMPARIALALQADGWYVRQDNIWHKPNPMPESVTDRCTKSHEYLFQISKSERYYFDAEAIKEPVTGNAHPRGDGVNPKARSLPGNKTHKGTTAYEAGAEEHRTKSGLVAYAERQREKYKTPDGWDTSKGEGGHGSIHKAGHEKGKAGYQHKPRSKQNESFSSAVNELVDRRNKRSVWTVGTKPFSAAHFATFPPALIEPCIKAGCPEGGTVLDPFGGAGTTGLVAERLGRNAVLIELNPEYAAMAHKRICDEAPLFAHDIFLETGIAAPGEVAENVTGE